jgi:hypothetical protein
MQQLSTSMVMATMKSHGLSGLSDVLQETNSFIAGSYSIPIEDLMGYDTIDDRDIDIWVPGEKGKGSSNQRLSTLVRFLTKVGYSYPQRIQVRSMNEGESSHYTRMESSIHNIYTLKCETKPPIQIMLLLHSAGSTPEEIVRNFDFTLLSRWYDGKNMIILEEAAQALEDRVLKINITKDVKTQSMHEWLRTAQRIKKYMGRNFDIQWHSNSLNPLLLKAAAGIYSASTHTLSIHLLKRWNAEIQSILKQNRGDQLPYLGVTICPPAKTISDLRVFCTMKRPYILNDPRRSWRGLTEEEQDDTIPVSNYDDPFLGLREDIIVDFERKNLATYMSIRAQRQLFID